MRAPIASATEGFVDAQTLEKYPEILKPLVARFIPVIKAIKKHYRAAGRAAIPLLQTRGLNGTKAMDLLYWVSDQAKGNEKNYRFLARISLKVKLCSNTNELGTVTHNFSSSCTEY